ncbi:Non-heme chloroperoxidase [Collimonas arenae]|uniref:Non-heme chloroperoxidase n=1 Tax=Collimonas arenae TaxID=279058 RepID=A0A0A1F407_9BURK|nr:alpha/beta hydrolase [Collimonas arenae]AIY39458.1 Non-heme chloroperoxidase [Collimonas arenae]
MSTFQTTDKTTLFFQDWGSGQPVLFVHSWAMNSTMWDPHMAHFNRLGLRTLAMDRRGHGRSDAPGTGYHYDRLADDLAELIEHCDLHNLTLVGHSMGCAEIVRYLARHGASRIARVVLIAPVMPCFLKSASNPDGVEMNVIEGLQEVLRKDFPKWLADNADDFFLPTSWGTTPEFTQHTIDMMLSTVFNAAMTCLHTKMTTDLRGWLAEITVPALVIHGDRDVSEPVEGGRLTAQLIRNSQYREYAGAPHGIYHTHMSQVLGDILHFAELGKAG